MWPLLSVMRENNLVSEPRQGSLHIVTTSQPGDYETSAPVMFVYGVDHEL